MPGVGNVLPITYMKLEIVENEYLIYSVLLSNSSRTLAFI